MQRHFPKFESNKSANKKTSRHGVAGSPKVSMGYICSSLNVYDVVPRVMKLNRNN